MKFQKRKSLLLSMCLVFILLFSVSAFGVSFTQETSGQWTKYGFDRYSSNSYVYPQSIFSGLLESGENFTYTDTEIAGGNFQPIAFDWDSDGVVEIIAPVGTTLKVYNPSTNTLVEEASYSMGGTMGVQGWCGFESIFGDLCVFNIGSELKTLAYDGSTIVSLASANIGTQDLTSPINCFSDGEDYSFPYCFARTSVGNMVQYRAEVNNDLTNISVGIDYNIADNKEQVLISDVDYDGQVEVLTLTGLTSHQEIELHNFEWNNATNSLSYDSNMGGLKVLSQEETLSANAEYSTFFIYDLDGANDEELCFTHHLNTAYYLSCYNMNTDATIYDRYTLDSGSLARPIQTLYGDIDGDSLGEIVVTYLDTGVSGNFTIETFDCDSGSCVQSGLYDAGMTLNEERFGTMSLINDDNNFDLVVDQYVFYSNETTFNDGEIKNFVDNENIVPVNFNQDAVMDFVGQKLNSLSLYTTGTGGLPTVSTISLNTDLDDSGFYNYYDTVCLDSTTTFKALECVSGVFDSTCTYINTDTSATERIYTTCGGIDSVNGSYDGLNPQVNCTWTSTGVFNVPLYMQDTTTPNYYGVSDTLQITVVDGTSGVDCNVPTDFISQPSDQTDTSTPTTINSAEDFFDFFSYGSETMQFFFGLIIILGLMVMAYSGFKSVFMAIIFGVAGLILATILGLIPLWVIIGMSLLMALPLLLKFAFGNNG